MIRSSRAPIFERDVIVMTNVLNIIYKFLPPLLRSLTSLNTLKDLSTVTTPLIPTCRSIIYRMTPSNDPIATKKSNKFHSSEKYCLNPQACNFKRASINNIVVNM
jgi:hypothetical protein